MEQKYKWLIDKLSDVFGKQHIKVAAHDWGTMFSVALIIDDDRRSAVRVERIISSTPVEWADVTQEDGSVINEPVRWEHERYSLNDDPNKDKLVEDLINRWRLI